MKTKRIFGTLTAVGATVAGLHGCSQEKAQVPLTPESATEQRNTEERKEEAVETLARAQCDRAARCNNIGPNTDYATREHCMTRMRQEAQDSVGKCDKGIDRDDLAQCVGEIQNQDCGGVSFEGMQTWIACSTDDLCLG